MQSWNRWLMKVSVNWAIPNDLISFHFTAFFASILLYLKPIFLPNSEKTFAKIYLRVRPYEEDICTNLYRHAICIFSTHTSTTYEFLRCMIFRWLLLNEDRSQSIPPRNCWVFFVLIELKMTYRQQFFRSNLILGISAHCTVQ